MKRIIPVQDSRKESINNFKELVKSLMHGAGFSEVDSVRSKAEEGQHYYMKGFIFGELGEKNDKIITFSLDIEKGIITVSFRVSLNNQYQIDTPGGVLWAMRAGASKIDIPMVFDRFTEETEEGLKVFIKNYFSDKEQSFMKMFCFEKEAAVV